MSIKIVIITLLTLLIIPCFARIITVDDNGPSDFTNIQAAINNSNNGDEIIVGIGTYYENINFNGKNIILRSEEPTNPVVVSNTIINGRMFGSVVTFSGAESNACFLSGFTIANGTGTEEMINYTSYSNGGGIYGNGTLATIQFNAISGNRALNFMYGSGLGGGLYNCDGIIQCNTISNNIAARDMESFENAGGGGLFGCDGVIQNNIISNNTISGRVEINDIGGGLSNCHGTIRNNTIFGNSAGSGGGLCNCTGTIINCIIWQNTAGQGAQIFASSAPSYCCIQAWSGGGIGNISDNPLLAAPESNDFHLQTDSPCKDIGSSIPELIQDFEGDLRPLGYGYDIGADEFISNNLPPDKPVNISPAYGTTNISLTPTLTASAFSDPDSADTHQASQWHVWITGTTLTVFASTKSTGDLLSVTIPSRILSDNITFSWKVRYQDQQGAWSLWSDSTDFTTELIGEIITVPGDYPTIQSAINAAIYGDEIVVSQGTYVENINFMGKNIVLRSTMPSDPCIAASTIIDGNQIGSVVTFLGLEPSSCILEGFTITNGHENRGGGICGNGTLAMIQNNIISRNSSESGVAYGGGLYKCNGILQDNTISENSVIGIFGGSGGGLYSCHGTIQKNLITGNSATATGPYSSSGSGGGLADCDGIIQNNIINENSADTGGGLIGCDGIIKNNVISGNFTIDPNNGHGGGLHQCHGTIMNNVICKNSTQGQGGGIYYSYGAIIQNNTICFNSGSYGGGLSRCRYDDTIINNCIIWGNTCTQAGAQIYNSEPIYFSCIQGWTGGGLGNIAEEPLFADPCNDDYHLQSQAGRWDSVSEIWIQDANTSMCIDAGDPNSDWTPELWPNGKRINMGAYGGTSEASMSLSAIGNIANLNNDPCDTIDLNDLAVFVSKWCFEEKLLAEDLNRNGFVDFKDFAVFGSEYFETHPIE